MPACKACGEWFAKTEPHKELCFKCESALCRLSGYVARVVRCKNCKHVFPVSNAHFGIMGYWCTKLNIGSVDLDAFCSYGERREDTDG